MSIFHAFTVALTGFVVSFLSVFGLGVTGTTTAAVTPHAPPSLTTTTSVTTNAQTKVTATKVVAPPPQKTAPAIVVDPDLVAVQASFVKLQQAVATQNASLYNEYTTTASAHPSSGKASLVTDFKSLTLLDTKKQGEAFVLTINFVDSSGSPSTVPVLFIKQNGVWKMGIAETLLQMFAPLVNAGTTNTNGCATTGSLPDLVISDASFTPAPPSLSGNVILSIVVKNIGQGEFRCGFKFNSSMNNGYMDLFHGIQGGVIPPGGSVTLKNEWSSIRGIIPVSQTVTVKFSVSADSPDTHESNSSNNTLTKTFEFVE